MQPPLMPERGWYPKDTVALHSNMGARGNLVVSQWVTRSVMLLSHSKQPLSEQLP